MVEFDPLEDSVESKELVLFRTPKGRRPWNDIEHETREAVKLNDADLRAIAAEVAAKLIPGEL